MAHRFELLVHLENFFRFYDLNNKLESRRTHLLCVVLAYIVEKRSKNGHKNPFQENVVDLLLQQRLCELILISLAKWISARVVRV